MLKLEILNGINSLICFFITYNMNLQFCITKHERLLFQNAMNRIIMETNRHNKIENF